MPESPPAKPAELHDQFVREIKEIGIAHCRGELRKWVEEKLDDERRAAGFDSDS